MNIGTLLTPNEYMTQNNKKTTGVIIEVREDIFGVEYKVFLAPQGFSKWLDRVTIESLFEVHK
jgi:hypothetical protein